jgi:DNA-binding XRE family transcriptional regulator
MATGSTLPQRAAGRELRRLRLKVGKSQAAAGKVIEVSPQTIGRMEDGQPTKLSRRYVNALCDEYLATADERQTLLMLAAEVEEARRSGGGWWRTYPVEPKFDHYLGLEEAARRLTTFQLTLLPGLLQTPEYRRDMIWVANPGIPPADVERRIELAIRRQARLNEDPKDFQMDVVLSEAVLRHQVGGPGVMAGQLRRLAEISKYPNVSIRVIPLRVGSHVGLQVGSFVLLEFPPLPSSRMIEPPVVYVEEYAGHLYLENGGEIEKYREAGSSIRRVALDESKTRALVLEIAEELESDR